MLIATPGSKEASVIRQAHQREVYALQGKLSESLELQGYYQKMAEDYRAKFLAMEREYNMLKHTHDFDIETL